MPGLRPGLFQHAGGIVQQRSLEESEAEIFAKGPDHRDVAVGEDVAGMPPFRRLLKPRAEAERPQPLQPATPAPGGTIRRGKSDAPPAAVQKELVRIADHPRLPKARAYPRA